MCVTIDGVWICEWIYWPLTHTTRNCKNLTALSLIFTLYKLLHAKFSQIIVPSLVAARQRILTLETTATVLNSLLSGEYPTTELSTEQ
jgi:hypothetical protein